MAEPAPRAVLFYDECFRRRAYGSNHPLAIPRVALTLDLLRACDGVASGEIAPARPATDEELAWHHTRRYVDALRRAEARGGVTPEDRERYALGTLENPYFDRVFSTPATAGGASVQGAEAVLAGQAAFNPAGGMHHARPDRAQGFCYVNDLVLGITRLRRSGARVLYVDLDAHHGDSVEDAFRDDPGTFTFSLHMDTAYAYPGSGGRFEDEGSAAGDHSALNLPLPRATNDAEYRELFQPAWERVLRHFAPDCVVMQAGADAIGADPLGRLTLTTQGFLDIVATVAADAPRHADGTPRLLATGGGGYHPIVVARAWAGVWSVLSGRPLAAAIPPAGRALLGAVEWELDDDEDRAWLRESLVDPSPPQPVRPEILELAARLSSHAFFAGRA